MGSFLWRYRFRALLVALILTSVALVIYPNVSDETRNKVYDLWKLPSYEAQTMLNPSQIHRARRKLVHGTCKRQINRTPPYYVPTEVLTLRSPLLSYCAVPTAGYTKWLRLLRYLLSNASRANAMLETDYEIHNKDRHLYKQLLDTGRDKHAVTNSVRTMTVRDPYTRLWAVYIDKLLLPDFWLTLGIKIVQTTREKVTTFAAKCGHDVTFPEFIHYVITHNTRSSNFSEDKYWLPASDLCDPCKFKPDIIGKQESLSADVAYVLEKVQLHRVAQNFKMSDKTEIDIQNEIDYNFRRYPKVRNCISDKFELCKRIWTSFILNGLVPSDETFPTNIYLDSLNRESFYELFKNVINRHNLTDSERNSRREHALATAYNQIPREHMKALRILYKKDFEFFGYDSDPKYLRR